MNDIVLYEDDIVYHADILLTQEWIDKAGSRSFYFKDSTLGNTYRILYRKDSQYLYNAETEYSAKVFAPVIDDIKSKPLNNILLMGLGTGDLIKKIREFSDCSIAVLERDTHAQYYKHTVGNDDYNLILGDVYNYNSFSRILKEYDVVIDDISPKFEYKIPFIRYNTNFSYYFMIDYRIFPCPYDFLRIDKDLSINKISEVDHNIVDFYKKMMYNLI